MVALAKIKPGDVLYDVRREKMGNTTMSRWGCWEVLVVSIDHEKQTAMCRWNYNQAKLYRRRDLERLKRSVPKAVRDQNEQEKGVLAMSTKELDKWRVAPNIYLEKREPSLDVETWETGIGGPHLFRVVLTKTKNMQWVAVVDDGLPAYSYDPYQALAEAQQKAIDSCNNKLFKLMDVVFYDN